MQIEHNFEYDAQSEEIADEFLAHDSEYQAEALNSIGLTFSNWCHDKTTSTGTYIQLLNIAKALNDKGKWFIEILYDYMRGDEDADSN